MSVLIGLVHVCLFFMRRLCGGRAGDAVIDSGALEGLDRPPHQPPFLLATRPNVF